jgi:hypothetical protein
LFLKVTELGIQSGQWHKFAQDISMILSSKKAVAASLSDIERIFTRYQHQAGAKINRTFRRKAFAASKKAMFYLSCFASESLLQELRLTSVTMRIIASQLKLEHDSFQSQSKHLQHMKIESHTENGAAKSLIVEI